jgi:hypothetical protein
MTESMPAWAGRTEWDDAALTGRLIVAITQGRYDERSGAILDATAPSRTELEPSRVGPPDN